MMRHESDRLLLRGRLQAQTALDALAYTGINPVAQQRLQTLLDVHEMLSDDQTQNDFVISMQGGTAAQEKSDIIASLDAVANSDEVPYDTWIAAIALSKIL